VLRDKITYILRWKEGEKTAYGECNLFKGLSYDDRPEYEHKLQKIISRLPVEGRKVLKELREWPSISFGVQTLLKDWENGARQFIFPEVLKNNGFTIPTNGLIWMGEKEMMLQQIKEKLKK